MRRIHLDLALGLSALLATACSQGQDIKIVPTSDSVLPVLESQVGDTKPVVETTQTFTFEQERIRKEIAVVFVVDNSGSMRDEQINLRNGMIELFRSRIQKRESNENYHAMVIATDYDRTRKGLIKLQPTFPEGYADLTDTEKNAYDSKLIADFSSAILVGVSGSGTELPGASMKALFSNKTHFAGMDHVQVIFATDENNYRIHPNADLPPVKGFKYGTLVDTRDGILDAANKLCTELALGGGCVSLTGFINPKRAEYCASGTETEMGGCVKPPTNIEAATTITQGLLNAVNVADATLRSGGQICMLLSAKERYAECLNDSFDRGVRLASSFALLHQPLSANAVSIDWTYGGITERLALSTDFEIDGNRVILSESLRQRLENLTGSHSIAVHYTYK